MEHFEAPESSEERFYSSNKSQLGKVRRWLWLGAAIGLVLPVIGNKATLGSFLLSAVFMLLIFGPIDWFMRRQFRPGQALLTLSHDAIESPVFTGKTKRYQWSDIASISVESEQGVQRLQFLLAESLGRPDKRSFWTGVNYARPAIPLSSLEPEVQEKLLEAVNRRFRQFHADTGEMPQAIVNPLKEEHEFQERLKSLAPIPWMTYLFIVINVLVWGFTVTNGAGVLLAPADKLLLWGGNAASEVQHGEWWRLLTATFLHSGFMHLFMNMLGLIGAGIVVERIYGHRLFVLIYLGSGLIGSALSLHFSAQHAVSVGASGAVFGVTGALLVGVFQHRSTLPKTFSKQTLSGIGFFIVYALMQGFSRQGIDNAAHVGGLMGGCVLAFLLPERFDMAHFMRKLKSRALAGMAVVLMATTGLAATAPHAALDMKKAFEGQAAYLRGMSGLDAAIKAINKEQQDVKAGRLTERESDERSRIVYAPMFRKIQQDLTQAALPPTDARLPVLKESKRMTELLIEALEMPSVYKSGSDKPEPADPVRMAAIQAEMNAIGARFQRIAQEAKAKQKQ